VQGSGLARELRRRAQLTWSRAELAQYGEFTAYSPEPGVIAVDAFRAAFDASPAAMFEMLPRLAKAADAPLRRQARRIAARIILREARSRATGAYGAGRLTAEPLGPDGELDIDASLEAILLARAGRTAAPPQLVARAWRRPPTAVSLIVDTSGSMSGGGIGNAALAAAAITLRVGIDFSVVVVSDRALILKAQGSQRPIERVIDDLLTLQSYGWTDLAIGLNAARAQLARAPGGGRRIAILLSDGRANRGGDPLQAARALDTLHVVSTADSGDAGRALAAAGRGRAVYIDSGGEIVSALCTLLAEI
jgi:Mg-chelatase subunit ChlD